MKKELNEKTINALIDEYYNMNGLVYDDFDDENDTFDKAVAYAAEMLNVPTRCVWDWIN